MSLLQRASGVVGPVLLVLVSLVGVRLASYWRSFLLHWRRYRRRDDVQTSELRLIAVPFVKIQITTRGSAGSTEVITRGIRNVQALGVEDRTYYRRLLSVEVVTESQEQADHLVRTFRRAPVPVKALVIPPDYETPNGTELKARGLHYAVEQRLRGWNRKKGRTFVVHYDEESVMAPRELRKLLAVLAGTDKKVLEGPIYYPLEYRDATTLCRAMEANRPVGCFECRQVMESGVPLHLHGSNLVVEEELENRLGWDIGRHADQPFIAEDYVFGMEAYLSEGRSVFGWHGCVMLEQPPFSVRSAFKQRYRWIFGVLQGMAMARTHPGFRSLGRGERLRLTVGTGYRIATFALAPLVGALSLLYLPVFLRRSVADLAGAPVHRLPWPVVLWIAVVGLLWLGSILIGAWYNLADARASRATRWTEIARAVAVAPVAGAFEGAAGLWAVTTWALGRREVSWQPTPKTKQADAEMDWQLAA